MLTRMMQLLSAIAGTGDPPAWPNWPLTSDEVYLYAILSGETDVPRPLTRRQQYLYRRATGSGELPEHPVTTEEIYWSVFAGEERELPLPLTELMPYIAAASAPPEPTPSYQLITPIDADAWQQHTGLKLITLDGSESWSAAGGGVYTSTYKGIIQAQARDALVGFSENYTFYPSITGLADLPEDGFMFNGTESNPVNGNLSFKGTHTTSAAVWKSWLAEHPVTILISVNNSDKSEWKPAIRVSDSVTGYWNGVETFVPVKGGIPYYGDNLVTKDIIDNYYRAYFASSGSNRYWRPATDTSRTIRIDVEAGKYYYAQWTETDSDIVGTVYRFGYTDIGEPKASTGNMVYDTVITTPQDSPSEIITATKAYMIVQFGGALFPENAGYFSIREMIGYEPPALLGFGRPTPPEPDPAEQED